MDFDHLLVRVQVIEFGNSTTWLKSIISAVQRADNLKTDIDRVTVLHHTMKSSVLYIPVNGHPDILKVKELEAEIHFLDIEKGQMLPNIHTLLRNNTKPFFPHTNPCHAE